MSNLDYLISNSNYSLKYERSFMLKGHTQERVWICGDNIYHFKKINNFDSSDKNSWGKVMIILTTKW